MTGGSSSTCIPAVELAHYLDPLDYDNGPLQRLAPHTTPVRTEPTQEAAPVPASDAASITPDVGYPLAV